MKLAIHTIQGLLTYEGHSETTKRMADTLRVWRFIILPMSIKCFGSAWFSLVLIHIWCLRVNKRSQTMQQLISRYTNTIFVFDHCSREALLDDILSVIIGRFLKLVHKLETCSRAD